MMLALVLATALSQGYYSPQEAQALFAQGNEAYGRDDFSSARTDYQKLVDHGQSGADVLYNLGTAALAEGDLGGAVLALERARKEGGAAPDVDANLALARSKQLDQVVGAGDDGLLPRLALSASDEGWGLTFLVMWVAGFGLLLLRRLVPPLRSTPSAVAAAVILAAAVPIGVIYGAHAYAQATVHPAVVVAKSLAAHDAPQASAKVSFEVHSGLRVRVMEEAAGFVRIRLPNGLEGWADREGVTEI
jgi:hypothetical protein